MWRIFKQKTGENQSSAVTTLSFITDSIDKVVTDLIKGIKLYQKLDTLKNTVLFYHFVRNMPISSPAEERNDLLNSDIFHPLVGRQTNCVSLKLIFHPFIYCSDFLSHSGFSNKAPLSLWCWTASCQSGEERRSCLPYFEMLALTLSEIIPSRAPALSPLVTFYTAGNCWDYHFSFSFHHTSYTDTSLKNKIGKVYFRGFYFSLSFFHQWKYSLL